jgi:KUP system potassium uptake protein
VKHNQVLHKQTVLLSIHTEKVPWIGSEASLVVRDLGHGFYRVLARVGFMQTPNVPRIIARCARDGLITEPPTTTYYLGRQTLITTGKSGMAKWRKMLFAFLGRNARPPTDFFGLPPNRVVELGVQIEL